MQTPRRRARRGEGELLREQILVATEELLLETGSEESVSIRAVADQVGVTPPSIYRHFEDKDELILEVCTRRFDEFDDHVETARRGADDPLGALFACGRAYVHFGVDHPEHYRIMFMTRRHRHPDEALAKLTDEASAFGHLVTSLQTAIDAGAVPDQDDAVRAALHLWSTVHGVTSLLITQAAFPVGDLDAFIDEHVAMCLRGLGADVAPLGHRRRSARSGRARDRASATARSAPR